VVAYADDTTPVTSRSEDIPHLEHWMSMYEQATGATFSRSKSELVLYNMTPPSATDFFPRIVTDPHFTFKFLGVPLSFHQNQDERWTGPLTKYQTCLKMWTRAGLSLQGKLVVLKHFAYPILTYQAQSVHVNEDVIEELESDAWKFFWGKKRGRVNYETTRLPKDNGGYGYSTFKDLLHKLQARWTIRLLQQWTSGKPWVALAKWMIAQVNSKWGHGLSTLYVQGGRHAAEKCPSPFWGACLKGFWRLNPHYELTQTQESALLARSMPLFHNPAIQHHQKPLNGSRWQTFTQVGIRRICDLIFHDHIGSYDEIVAYYGHLPRPAVTDLLAALPATLTDIATTTAALTPDTEWAHTTNTGHRAYSVTENPLRGGPYLPHAHCWDMDNLEDPEPDYLGIRPVADILELRPARLTFDVEGQIRLAYCDNMEIDVNQLTYGPPPPITGTPKNEEEWTRSLFPPPSSLPNWNRLYRSSWKADVPNRWKDTWWLMARKSLFLGATAAKIGLDYIPEECSLCGGHSPETHAHLFYDCPAAQQAWRWCALMWRKARKKGMRLSMPLALFGGDSLWRTLALTTITAIWKARCHSVFGTQHPQPLFTLKNLIINLIKITLTNKKPVEVWCRGNAFGHLDLHGNFVFSSF